MDNPAFLCLTTVTVWYFISTKISALAVAVAVAVGHICMFESCIITKKTANLIRCWTVG